MNLVVGLDKLIVSSAKEYVSLAVKLATDREYYESVREPFLVGRLKSPLFDVAKWTCNLEKGLLEAWEMWLFDGQRADIWLDSSGC